MKHHYDRQCACADCNDHERELDVQVRWEKKRDKKEPSWKKNQRVKVQEREEYLSQR